MTDLKERAVTIARRFCGPPGSGNGGYVSGLVASLLNAPAEVTLKAPPPLDTKLTLRAEDGRVQLLQSETVLASARPGLVDVSPRPAPSLEEAEAAGALYAGFNKHLYPECFVCGTQRRESDGLRVFAGATGEKGVVAGVWTPAPGDADSEGRAPAEFTWAALDCPGYFALFDPVRPALLGRMTAEISERPQSGEPCIVLAWRLGRERRKHLAASALYSMQGRLLALAKAVWIEMPRS